MTITITNNLAEIAKAEGKCVAGIERRERASLAAEEGRMRARLDAPAKAYERRKAHQGTLVERRREAAAERRMQARTW